MLPTTQAAPVQHPILNFDRAATTARIRICNRYRPFPRESRPTASDRWLQDFGLPHFPLALAAKVSRKGTHMDRLDSIRTLLAAVDGGSMSAAGRALNMPLPTVSRKISDLEEHLGAKLLVRSTRGLRLTDAGAGFVTAARSALDQLAEAERAAAGEYAVPRGELVVTAPVMLGRMHVLPVIAEFLAAHPQVDIRLVLADRHAHLIDEHVDVAVRIGALPDSTMMATRIGEVRPVICASPSLLAQLGEPERPDALPEYPCIAYEGPGADLFWNFRDGGYSHAKRQPARRRLTVTSTDAAIDAAITGIGLVSVLSYQAMPAIREGRLQVVLEKFETTPIPVHIVHPGQGLVPAKTRTFIDFASGRLRQLLARA
ncbi:LysR family transcriptional regulator [Novosphingobium sp. BL-8H]|uniref:LysR family transcriptional regulator n=1 Tax=Novosphingobium sp. BL-8H TaxID=3127640 RepID=UPI003757A400